MLLAALVLARSGSLFLSGGGTTDPAIVDAFLKACGGKAARVVVLPLANEDPKTGKSSEDFLHEHGATNTIHFAVDKPSDADRAELKKQLDGARGVWMPGGQQQRFIDRLGEPWIKANVVPLLKKGVNFYGTSAGSMVCAATMIVGPGKEKDTAETGPGFGLTKWVIDTHFKQRNREGRLRDALKTTGLKKGVGINETEWIVIRDDRIVEKHGTPTVIEIK